MINSLRISAKSFKAGRAAVAVQIPVTLRVTVQEIRQQLDYSSFRNISIVTQRFERE